MAYKIFLSPSSQKANTYAYGNTTEDVQCGKIAKACKAALERCGFEVKLEQYDTTTNRVNHANAWGADLYVPIHTNAFNGQVTGTRIFCDSLTGESYKASKAIFDALAPITPGKSENIKASTQFYELRAPKAPPVYVEAEFHDNKEAAKWIIENTAEIGEAIAKGICNYFKVAYKKTATVTEKPSEALQDGEYYQVVTGSFKNKKYAEQRVKELAAKGFDSFIQVKGK